MNIPGFTADSSLYQMTGHYRAVAGTAHSHTATALTLALDTAPDGTPIVDCKDYPDSNTCQECNNTGPGTLECCTLGHPTGPCIVLNDPNYPGKPVPPTRWWLGGTGENLFRM
jgi:hypothetical protein